MKKIILGLMFIPLISFGQLQKSLIGFQNIPWGSSIVAVKGKFPSAKDFDYCNLFASTDKPYAQLKQEWNSKSMSCLNLQVEHYRVEGMDFKIFFEFDELNKLKGANLSTYFDSENNPGYLKDCDDAYKNTESLLTSRYGESGLVSNTDRIDDTFTNADAKIWLPLPTEVYVVKLWNSKLRKSFNKPDICKVSVHYGKRVPNAASKL